MDKYINAIEEIIMEPECEAFTEYQRREIGHILYGFQMDIKAHVLQQTQTDVDTMINAAFSGMVK